MSDDQGPLERLCSRAYATAQAFHLLTQAKLLDAAGGKGTAVESDLTLVTGTSRGIMLGICAVTDLDDVEAGPLGKAWEHVAAWRARHPESGIEVPAGLIRQMLMGHGSWPT